MSDDDIGDCEEDEEEPLELVIKDPGGDDAVELTDVLEPAIWF